MERIKGRGKGKLQKENDDQVYEVSYSYELKERITTDRGVLSGFLEDVGWELGRTLNGAICDLHLEEDGLPRKILIPMSSPFSVCTVVSEIVCNQKSAIE